MSWLRNTVNTGLSSISGQLKDILNENTDDIVGKFWLNSIDCMLLSINV